MDMPTSTGSTNRGGSARSSHRKRLSRGMASFTRGSQAYNFCDSPARRSGWSGRVWMMAWYRPIQMGIWMNMGPRHPRGLTPFSLYRRMVSWDCFCLSSGYFWRISIARGWISDIFLVIRICFSVRGRVTTRMITVNTRMLAPKLAKNRAYSSTRMFIMGPRMSWFHTVAISSSTRYLSALCDSVVNCIALMRPLRPLLAPGRGLLCVEAPHLRPEPLLQVDGADGVVHSAKVDD